MATPRYLQIQGTQPPTYARTARSALQRTALASRNETRRVGDLLSPGPLHLDHAITFCDEDAVQSALPLIIDPWSDNSAGNSQHRRDRMIPALPGPAIAH